MAPTRATRTWWTSTYAGCDRSWPAPAVACASRRCGGSAIGSGSPALPHLSLRGRLALAFSAGMAAVLIAVGAFVYLQVRRDLLASVDMGLNSRAQVMVADALA